MSVETKENNSPPKNTTLTMDDFGSIAKGLKRTDYEEVAKTLQLNEVTKATRETSEYVRDDRNPEKAPEYVNKRPEERAMKKNNN